MTAWDSASVSAALGIRGPGGLRFSGVGTDTRHLTPGTLFVALKGERFDAHDFLRDAQARGATAAVVRRGTPPVDGLPFYEVGDTLEALGLLGRARRRALAAGSPVVAITGSSGKTSTKEMIRAALATRWRVHATTGNLNNLIGVPLTILAAPPDTTALVVEAGASVPGEIARLRGIIEPTIAVITNVGYAHVEGFGSLEGVMREKLALTAGVLLAIVGTEPPELAARTRQLAHRVIAAGLDGADRVPEAVWLSTAGRATLRVEGREIALPLVGRHQAANAMLTWTLVQELDLDRSAAAAALEGLVIPGGRGELVQHGALTILNDCYNANPSSFRAAIATAEALRRGRRLVFVAGTMRELGREAVRHHTAVAQELVDLEPDLLAVVGDFVPALTPYGGRLGDRLLAAPDAPTLGPMLAARLRGDELVVLKASRGVALERIIPLLTRG